MISERRENILGTELRVVRCSAVIIGSGAAAFNAALCLKEGSADSPLDILLVTEGMNMGTSRNTGSTSLNNFSLLV